MCSVSCMETGRHDRAPPPGVQGLVFSLLTVTSTTCASFVDTGSNTGTEAFLTSAETWVTSSTIPPWQHRLRRLLVKTRGGLCCELAG